MAKRIITPTRASMGARQVRQFALDSAEITGKAVRELSLLGIEIPASVVKDQIRKLIAVGDAAYTPQQTSASIPTPLQFLQQWLPGFVKTITAARKVDELVGIKTIGSWEDAQIVQGILEPGALAAEYGDLSGVPLSSYNVAYEARDIVRGEMGMAVFLLEEARAAAIRVSTAEEKRQGAAVALEQMRNAIGIYGWSNGTNRTFGMLNEPGLLPIQTVAGGKWVDKDFLGICKDIRMMVRDLRVQSQDRIDPETTEITLALPTTCVDFLSVTSNYGVSVRDWINATYKKMRIVSVPEFTVADPATGSDLIIPETDLSGNAITQTITSGTNVVYLYAESVDAAADGSTDGGETFAQLIQTKFLTLGVEKRVKSYVESYSNAVAGVLCKRPYAVVRYMGI